MGGSTGEVMSQQQLHQKFLIHILCAIIMGADIILDIMQAREYGNHGNKTKDLFIASLVTLSIVPAGLAIAAAYYVTQREISIIFKFFEDKKNFQWGLFIGAFLWCLTGLFVPLVLGTFFITLVLSFPVMAVIIVFTPLFGVYVIWSDIGARQKLRFFYFIRYSEGLVCSLPNFIINILFMQRVDNYSTQSIASAVFSAVSLCQVLYQAFGLKRMICRCKDNTCVSLDGFGTLKEIIEWHTEGVNFIAIAPLKTSNGEKKPVELST